MASGPPSWSLTGPDMLMQSVDHGDLGRRSHIFAAVKCQGMRSSEYEDPILENQPDHDQTKLIMFSDCKRFKEVSECWSRFFVLGRHVTNKQTKKAALKHFGLIVKHVGVVERRQGDHPGATRPVHDGARRPPYVF